MAGITIEECAQARVLMAPYIEGRLNAGEKAAMEEHLACCSACRETLQRKTAYVRLLEQAYADRRMPQRLKTPSADILKETRFSHLAEDAAARTEAGNAEAEIEAELGEEGVPQPPPMETDEGEWYERLGAAPWWVISGVFHGLLLLLLGLLSMVALRDASNETVITTDLAKAKPPEFDERKPRDVFRNRVPVPTEQQSEVENPVVAHEQVTDDTHNETDDNMDSNTARGDPNAISDLPLGGLGTSAALGLGGGGAGCFGQRGGGGKKRALAAHGGGKATESAVEAALRWLARHQEQDGHWDTKKYDGEQCVDAGVTGLALLAFLGAGHTERAGQYRDNVRRAVEWIISQQEPDGSIGKKYKEYWHPGYAYHHAICGLALAEAAGMGRVPATIEAAQKAVDYSTEKHQAGEESDKGPWRYLPKQDADASVSGWFVMQLKSAKLAGLRVNPASFHGAIRFFDSIEVKKDYNGYPGGRFPYQQKGHPTLNPTAIGMLSNLFLGRKPQDIQGGAEYLLENLPKWDKSCGKGGTGTFPMYYTYYATLVMFQMGGDYWKKWNEAMKQMLLPNQRKGGDEDGSWDPLGGGDDKMAGRVYMTAMGALCLEVYYRYLPIHR